MGTQTKALADEFENVNSELIVIIEGCSDALWHTPCPGEGRSMGVVAHHVAADHQPIARVVHDVAKGVAFPRLSMQRIDQENALHAVEHATCTREEVLRLLKDNGAVACRVVRELDDEDLLNSAEVFADRPTMNARQIIERILIGHPRGHLANIKAASA